LEDGVVSLENQNQEMEGVMSHYTYLCWVDEKESSGSQVGEWSQVSRFPTK